MCGIVGLFLKDKSLEPKLGGLLSDMLITMTDRGPDSAGIAIYNDEDGKDGKMTVQSDNPDEDFDALAGELGKEIGTRVGVSLNSTHAVLDLPADKLEAARLHLARRDDRPRGELR